MRILALTNLYPNPLQPFRAPFNRLQLRKLAARHAVRVIAPVAWTDELRAWRKGGRLPPGRRTELDGIEVEHPRYWFTPKVLQGCYGAFYRWSVRKTFARAVAEFRPDLVYAPWAYPDGWAAVELGRRAGLPVVLKVHGSDVLMLDAYPARKKPTAEALRQADGVVAVSKDLAGKVQALGVAAGRVTVVYDGIDAGQFRPGPRDEARRRIGVAEGEAAVLFVGNLVPVKGPDVLLSACAVVARRHPALRCYLVGQGPLCGALEKQAAALGLGERVKFVGALPHEQLPDWYRAADVLALPSRSEGVPCVLLEALACDTPFVASEVGGVPEVARMGVSRLVPPGDVDALAAALNDLLAPGRRPGGTPRYTRGHAEAAADLEAFFGRVLHAHAPGAAREELAAGAPS